MFGGLCSCCSDILTHCRHQLQIGKAIDVLSASGFLTRANPNISPRNVNSYMHMSVLHSVLVCMLHDTIQCEENMRTGLRIEVRKKFEEILQQFCDYCTSDIMNDHILHAISHTCYMMQHEGDVNSIHSALSCMSIYSYVLFLLIVIISFEWIAYVYPPKCVCQLFACICTPCV